ncbi:MULTISPECIES: SNF2-related protein [Paenibacillus]|jgi:SNF2 family DNA or RNA helicase|uniref:ATP-dependent helicase n=1 Tax=Paenibacillus odorifer TaxID=189426 RepID=A0AAD0KLL9_9BACL|nr:MULTISPECIES: SNF2-related protein [Paenibacillus]AWV33033.1 ATP-dependent helicase [Paenibacillus odorifer]MDH6426546.1 SNF2 family DNA or RNA helicase [Paenibacillus sp. PastH-4]MDH6442570.1 SNF2 family DNA or RNA helicase [Paenibacillus sp. PastF-4]MDH6526718.1 SNF2 family DNA or RNA helicase [Paenibacillus sp. PastH-3]OMC75256.1 ATP-dependent helicase [Paenibacillus odorifer]
MTQLFRNSLPQQGGTPAPILPVPLSFDRNWLQDLELKLEKGGPWGDYRLSKLAVQGEETGLVTSFDELQCMKHLSGLSPLPHQLDTAHKVLFEMSGRAILADEVGLGKTIEAGLVLKEYLVRGLVSKVLILVPASLVLQWVRELNAKFGITAVAQKKAYSWGNAIVVASMDTAKRDPHKEILLENEYDMLIIDEAHKLKNKKSTNYLFVQQLRKKYCLLLTATPVQNDLGELFNLITILKPGQLGNQGDFASNFVVDKRQPKNEGQLRDELSKVMIRNRRGEGPVNFTKRKVRNIPLVLSQEEKDLYNSVTSFVKDQYQESGGNLSSMLSLVTLQREVCSSRDAVFITLVNLIKKLPADSPKRDRMMELLQTLRTVKTNTKAETTLALIQEMNEKVIVFTEYRATQEYLLQYFREHGLMCVSYSGGMNRGKKDWMMDLFRGRAQVMIATEAGGEGINLQFCHHMINFDLPWNPMRVEQRIGRVHRLGQENDVVIYNLSTQGTIEEHILHLLHEKINMFEMVIGGLDVILERFEKKESLEKSLYKIMLESRSDEELRHELDHIGESLSELTQGIKKESGTAT